MTSSLYPPDFSSFAASLQDLFSREQTKSRLSVYETIDSTNAQALRDIGSGSAQVGDCYLAYSQDAGRGTGDRSWWSPPGAGLWMTRIESLLDSPRPFAFWPALAALRALRKHGYDVHLKWPNDILLGAAKLGGCLIQTRTDPSGHTLAAIGLGLNLYQVRFPKDLEGLGISLRSHDQTKKNETASPLPSPSALIATILDSFEALRPSSDLRTEFRQSSRMFGKNIAATAGDKQVVVRVLGLDESGHLKIEYANGHREVWGSGDHFRIKIDPSWATDVQ
ncbi:MAG: biotin--[acetyl-CoA-carboxylase] ligase [Planctomycetota bacterium]